ncbi:MAG: DUF2959 family protein [Syntrophales bacterium]|jgi:hypothetical protein|nr:DUF2959 family protein [Syntrophales bacterium]
MKRENRSLAFFTMLLLGTAVFLNGCATTGMDRSVKTSKSIEEVDSDIKKISVQIDVTATALDSLIKSAQPDLKKSFGVYSDAVANLESQGNLVIKHIEEMKLRSTKYFAEWEKQGDAYTNPRIRELSEERRKKLAEMYDQVPTAGSGIKLSYLACLTDLKEIQKYLSNDLTPKGIEAVTPVAEKSVQELDSLKASLKPVITALEEIKAELYGGKK